MAKAISKAATWACIAAGAASTAGAPAEAHRKLLARFAARADAVGKLAEQLGGLKLTAGATVKDFLASSEGAGTALAAFLSGLKETSDPNYAADGTCRVELAVTVPAAAGALKHIHKRFYRGEAIKPRDFDAMVRANQVGQLKAAGTGRVPQAFRRDRLVPKTPEMGFRVPPGAAAFWGAHCSAGAARAAERAARLDALRRLAQRLENLHVTPAATLREFLAASDDPNVDLRTFLKGARQTALRYHADAPIVEADVQVELRTVHASLRSWSKRHLKGGRDRIARLEELTVRAAGTTLTEMGVGVPADKDIKAPTPAIRRAAALGRAMPPWASRSLKATATAATAPAAELSARIDLADLIARLPVAGTTVGHLAAAGEGIEKAVLIAQQAAHIHEEARATVTVELGLRDLWYALLHHLGRQRTATTRPLRSLPAR